MDKEMLILELIKNTDQEFSDEQLNHLLLKKRSR